MSAKHNSAISSSDVTGGSREWSTKAFLAFLGITSLLYATILIYHVSKPPDQVVDKDGILEQCRQICMQYGLISTGHVRKDAEAYLNVVQSHKLTEGLAVILADNSFKPVESQPLELLNQPAPEFSLPDVNGIEQKLSELGRGRPVVVVFYLGYGCSHCVAQLLALDKDLHYFSELDADIVAISSDSPEHTAERYKEYGEFHFPVLADVDYAVSRKWGVYQPDSEEKSEFMYHGTFIVDAHGKVIWGAQGKEPFLDNKTLLHVLAKSQGLLPAQSIARSEEPVKGRN
jgi:thioredoxin-dependent peroxiredoxin